MTSIIYKYALALLDLFYPQLCISCETGLTEMEEIICISCEHHLPKSHYIDYSDNPLEKLFWGRVKIKSVGALFFFNKGGPIREMMHQFKYGGRKDIGSWMGKKLGEKIIGSKRFENIDCIVPIPLHSKKEFKRGFNQSEELARAISESVGVHVAKALLRKKHTSTQTKKSKYERWLNVGNTFCIDSTYSLKGKNILLIDDVITTGATIEACAHILLAEKVKSISVLTIACA